MSKATALQVGTLELVEPRKLVFGSVADVDDGDFNYVIMNPPFSDSRKWKILDSDNVEEIAENQVS